MSLQTRVPEEQDELLATELALQPIIYIALHPSFLQAEAVSIQDTHCQVPSLHLR